MDLVLTIGITSYKRVNELERCIRSISTRYIDDIEVLVSEDHSPLSNEIGEMVKKIQKESPYRIRFSSNTVNLGYDMNLGEIIRKSNGQYIFFLSDDDAVCEGFLDQLIPFLKDNDSYGVLYSPFVYTDSGMKDRNHTKDFPIEKGEKSASKFIYDSILFSGLIFKKKYVETLDPSRFKNYNYFQVYMFLNTVFDYGGYYFKNPSILCIGDGENAYGISESSGGNEILANRKSVKSNLEFNKTLIKIIGVFDKERNTNVLRSFAKQYSLHSYSGLSLARAEGKKYFKEYWKILKNLDIKLYPICRVYFILLYIFGKKATDKLLGGFRKHYKKQ